MRNLWNEVKGLKGKYSQSIERQKASQVKENRISNKGAKYLRKYEI